MLNSKFNYVCSFMVFFFFTIIFFFLKTLFFKEVYLLEIELFFYNSISFSFIFYLDWMCCLFCVIVSMISSLILIYGKEYMSNDCYRFLWLTFLFVSFMLLMIMSPSILGVILGWDGLGLISYCLVIYYQSSDSFNSGFITAASNRMGDSMLILSIAFFSMSGEFLFFTKMSMGFVFFFTACLTKSAQIPFSAWLPAAMAAPTPISSLVHSSTLVTAGVYMLIRFSGMLLESKLNTMLMLISILTIFMAGFTSFFENDMKRVVALSTLGQLGFMMMILSMGYSNISYFHLLVHALFKALLFMCAGAVIHSGVGIQDMRKMGSMKMNFLLKLAFSISSFCLMGIPFTSGFYSKDFLLEMVSMSNSGMGLGVIMLMAALITVSYSIRLLAYLSSHNYWVIWINSSKKLLVPIFLLTLMNMCGGCLLNWLILDELDYIFMSKTIKITPLVLISLGCIWQGVSIFNFKIYYFMNTMFFMSLLTSNTSFLINYFFSKFKLLDQGWMESTLLFYKTLLTKNFLFLKSMSSSMNFFTITCLVISLVILF